MIREVIGSVRHSSNEDTNRMSIRNRRQVLGELDRGGIEGQSNLVTIRGQVIRDGVLDDFQEFLGTIEGTNGEFV